jgi:hypothetical protein
MKQLCLVAVLSALAFDARAVGRLADVTIIDRETGATLQSHYHQGEYWVEGKPGVRYAIRLQSRDGSRLLAVTSVDGVNVVSGQTAGFDQRGYVFMPWQGYSIDGWRKSNSEIAAFTFTSLANSYAARTGRPDNVGVVGVALFRERTLVARRAEEAQAGAAPSAQASANEAGDSAESASRRAWRADRDQQPAAKLGTGHGQREDSRVVQVEFERQHEQPDEIIRIRYDSHASLVAKGVIRSGRDVPKQPRAFPSEPLASYVPDP